MNMPRLTPESRITISLVTLLVTASLMAGCFLLVSAREENLRAQMTNAARMNAGQMTQPVIEAGSTPFEIAPGTFVTRTLPVNGEGPDIRIHWQSRFAAFGDTVAWILIFGVPASIAAVILFGFSYLRAVVIIPLRQENDTLRSQVAATRDMQMFAHDVRKPFSALKAVIDVLQLARAPDEAAKVARKLLPEIEGLLIHVDQMIADILQKNAPEKQASVTALDQALVEAVRESERKHPQATHPIKWQMQHTKKIPVADKDLVRAVANLLCNAIEAMGPNDSVTLISGDTQHQGAPAVELRVRNSGPVIPETALKTLFTPFFTSGKKNGTGLGLAYVQQMAQTAGGFVTAASDAKKGTEFVLILPAAPALDKQQVALPAQFNAGREQHMVFSGTQNLSILVVEDNDIYFEALALAVKDVAGEQVTLIHARSAAEGINLLSTQPDVLICDMDLGDQDNGLTVIRAALSQINRPAIYVHSNAVLSVDEDQFIALHTHGYLAKPVAKDAVAALIAAHARSPKPQMSKPKIAVIDDDCFVRELWSMKGEEVEAVTFSSPEEFKAALKADKDLLASLRAIVIDYYFEGSSEYTGETLANELRPLATVPLIMSSDATGLSSSAVAAFDLIVKKDCLSWDDISRRLTHPDAQSKVVS